MGRSTGSKRITHNEDHAPIMPKTVTSRQVAIEEIIGKPGALQTLELYERRGGGGEPKSSISKEVVGSPKVHKVVGTGVCRHTSPASEWSWMDLALGISLSTRGGGGKQTRQ